MVRTCLYCRFFHALRCGGQFEERHPSASTVCTFHQGGCGLTFLWDRTAHGSPSNHLRCMDAFYFLMSDWRGSPFGATGL
ncbi:uncharacterized protein YALI1_D00813g [Yarrowia lipolytica]|uniref:Uncharacterized protein n=1 Tax=Yarrowia lipolytica TaxID=4952 RepID=A0A1D8NCN3_YARLL|nr:hypothetical protein YALI1_D00813g [Yarrowia lipolytica]